MPLLVDQNDDYTHATFISLKPNGGRVMTAVQRQAPRSRPYRHKNALGPQEMRA